MNSVFNLIDEMEGYFEQCKSMPFSNKIMVDIDVIYEFMTDLRLKLPQEIKQSQRVIEQKEKIMFDAQRNADNIEKETEDRMMKLVNEHEIMQKAYKEAEKVVGEAKNTAREMKLGAYEYVDEMISQIEVAVRDTLGKTNDHIEKFGTYMEGQLQILEDNRRQLQDRKN
jgi:vacuolar-type H+-ATPase subunit H